MDNQLSVYQHPALTVLIDDSPSSALDSIDSQLSPQLARITFRDPHTAIDWLNHVHLHSSGKRAEPICVGFDEQSDSFQRRSASIDLDLIYHAVTNRGRFDLPAVLVIDYAMAQMDGIEFCKAVQNLPCKKILLTGPSDEKIVIDAFNRKLIDRFIKKNSPDAISLLETEIIGLQKDFFASQSYTLKDLLSRHSYTFLTDPAIATLAEQLCNRYRFVEYYLFPNPTGILFFDMQGRATLMVIATRDSLTTQFEMALAHGAPPELLAALQEFRLVPFFSDTHGTYQSEIGNDWLPYCLPPQICHGQQDYYWALFDLPPHYLQVPVYSYAEFLRERETA